MSERNSEPEERPRVDLLTPRELAVIDHIAKGRETPRIAEALYVSPFTVRTHVRNAMAKVGARTRAQLVAIVMAAGLVPPDAAGQDAREKSPN